MTPNNILVFFKEPYFLVNFILKQLWFLLLLRLEFFPPSFPKAYAKIMKKEVIFVFIHSVNTSSVNLLCAKNCLLVFKAQDNLLIGCFSLLFYKPENET